MKRIYKFAAVGISGLMATFALTPAALAASSASGAAAGRALTLPNSNIKGNPPKWSPSSLSAKARWTNGTPCTTTSGSFTETNTTSKSQTVKATATGISGSLKSTIPAHKRFVLCITKGYHGTVHVKLVSDGKVLSVTF